MAPPKLSQPPLPDPGRFLLTAVQSAALRNWFRNWSRQSASPIGVDADRDIGALDDHRAPGIGGLGVGVIPQSPPCRTPSVLAKRAAMSLLGLVLGVARSTATKFGAGPSTP